MPGVAVLKLASISKWAWIPAATVATISALSWVVVTAWPAVGWVTPAAHARDIDDARTAIATSTAAAIALEQRLAQQIKGSFDDLSEQIKRGQDEYTCDKLDAELRELRRQLRANPGDPDLVQDILRLEERRGVNGLNCARFEV